MLANFALEKYTPKIIVILIIHGNRAADEMLCELYCEYFIVFCFVFGFK